MAVVKKRAAIMMCLAAIVVCKEFMRKQAKMYYKHRCIDPSYLFKS